MLPFSRYWLSRHAAFAAFRRRSTIDMPIADVIDAVDVIAATPPFLRCYADTPLLIYCQAYSLRIRRHHA